MVWTSAIVLCSVSFFFFFFFFPFFSIFWDSFAFFLFCFFHFMFLVLGCLCPLFIRERLRYCLICA